MTGSKISQTGLTLNWPAAVDNEGVVSYSVYQNSKLLNTVAGTTYSYNVTGLTQGTSYSFSVVAYDLADNSSNPLTVTLSTVSVTPGNGSGSGATPTPSPSPSPTPSPTSFFCLLPRGSQEQKAKQMVGKQFSNLLSFHQGPTSIIRVSQSVERNYYFYRNLSPGTINPFTGNKLLSGCCTCILSVKNSVSK
ncbi:fibronectin type III domain-containing protein [Paenibacillus sp. BAC0078]